MRLTAIKVAFLASMALALSGQLLAQNEILCRAQCNQERLAFADKHACCPALRAPEGIREKLAQNCGDCREITPPASAIIEAQANQKTEPQSVSALEIRSAAAIVHNRVFARSSYTRTDPVFASIPIRLHRFLI